MFDLGNCKIGFIGFGNMAQAIAHGWLHKKAIQPGQIFACAKNWEDLRRRMEAEHMHPCKTAAEVADQADVIIIAVKPHLVRGVVVPIKEILKTKIVVSVAAGFPFEQYEKILAPGTHHLSTIPNTPVSIGEGIFICEKQHSLNEEEYSLIESLFSKIGMVRLVETQQLSIAGTISGCGPAFVSMFMEALGDAAVQHGLPRALAYQLAGQMTAGTGNLLVKKNLHPGAMKDAVCSPGGTTIIGVSTLERKGFRSAVIDAVAAIEKN